MKKWKELITLIRKELLLCMAVPIFIAVLLNTSATQGKDFVLFLMVGSFCVFAYGIVKMFFIIQKNKAGFGSESKSGPYLCFILIVAIMMPLAGLSLNNGQMFGGAGGGIFGDFSNIWFYLIAVLNGLVMLADIRADKLGLGLFYLKVVGFTYITYFAIVFMPILPYGLIGLIYFGLGILIFAPITVFITETFQILRDVRVLKTKFKTGVIVASILGVVTIPAALTINFSLDRVNFNHALAYLTYEALEMPPVNLPRLRTSLTHIERAIENRQQSRGLFDSGMSTPILSKFYQVIALDDKILSPDTTERLNRIFFGTGDEQPFNLDDNAFDNVNVTNISTSTAFDEEAGVYKTWVDMEIKNDSAGSLAEYKTEFALPEGCFIKDYYLYVGNEKKQGILADKRAALITYNNIIRTPKDPGIIYYKSDQMVELRVYPFDVQQVRKTGFLVMHSQNETLDIDGNKVMLTAEKSIKEPIDVQGVSFVPASAKSNLPKRERTPKYYFVIDASENSPYQEHLKKAAAYMEKHQITDAEVHAVSYKVEDVGKSGIPDTGESAVKCEGGFNLPFAVEKIFREFEESEHWFPVIIAVSDNINKAPVFQKSSIAKQFPESESYYNLGYDLSLTPYSFSDQKRQDIVKEPVLAKALDYNGLVVAANGKSEIVISGDFGDYTDNEYHNAFMLYGKGLVYSENGKRQVELVRDSFRQRLLTKYTAFTVLETKEQEEELLKLQAEFLNNDGKDAPAVMMDEPGLFVCAAFVLGFVLYRRKRRSDA